MFDVMLMNEIEKQKPMELNNATSMYIRQSIPASIRRSLSVHWMLASYVQRALGFMLGCLVF